MRNLVVMAAATAALCTAAPASAAIVFDFGAGGTDANNVALGANATSTSFTFQSSADPGTAVVRGYLYGTATSETLASDSGSVDSLDLAATNVRRSSGVADRPGAGVGVCQSGDTAGDQCNQTDSNGINEILSIAVTPGDQSLDTATFSIIDSNDTLNLFGVSNGTYTRLGYFGSFADGFVGSSGIATVKTSPGSSPGVYDVILSLVGGYDEYWFAQNMNADDGFRLDAVALSAVPEPTAWAMMIGGFALVGIGMRRRRHLAGRAQIVSA